VRTSFAASSSARILFIISDSILGSIFDFAISFSYQHLFKIILRIVGFTSVFNWEDVMQVEYSKVMCC
jgi:hypothetical protein